MGCASCSSEGGTPKGCKNNGTCSSGGCNKLEVYDWLANIAMPAGQEAYSIVNVRLPTVLVFQYKCITFYWARERSESGRSHGI